ncbi:hypothetical protein EDC01DRAFT_251552 [Geopyxis carbonaria]|nr:hypothetical protein EDC01DRAFT_251552 [Geopyxis carbonaria]
MDSSLLHWLLLLLSRIVSTRCFVSSPPTSTSHAVLAFMLQSITTCSWLEGDRPQPASAFLPLNQCILLQLFGTQAEGKCFSLSTAFRI